MTRISALPKGREPLLGPAAQKLELALIGARTAGVLRRLLAGTPLDDVDRASITQARSVLETAAEAVEFVASGGSVRRAANSFSFGAMAFTVEMTAPTVSPDDLPAFLRAMAADLVSVEELEDATAAERLLPAFSMLADIATRQAGTVGEGGQSAL